MDFYKYLADFEQAVATLLSPPDAFCKTELVSARDCKLAAQNFGLRMGKQIESDQPFAIDYYGYTKKSAGFHRAVTWITEESPGAQVKSVSVPLVHFAAIKVEHVVFFMPELLSDFYQFKQRILDLRGFKR